jgi:hypothetical protein
MLILAVETSSPVCGVSLCTPDGEKDREILIHPRVHAEKLAVICKELLDRNALHVPDLHGIAVSSGPGSFTGLRIGMSFVKGLAYPFRIPIAAVNTLKAFRNTLIEIKNYGDTDVCLIPSHRDFVYTLGSDEIIRYLKKKEISDTYPDCTRIWSNQEVPGVPFPEQEVEPIMPEWIGKQFFQDSSLKMTTKYDGLKIYYGSRYEPVQWKQK